MEGLDFDQSLQNREGGSGESVANQARSRFLAEVRATDLSGVACEVQPGAGDIPTLSIDEPSSGCQYRNRNNRRVAQGEPDELPEMNTEELYRQSLRETVRINVATQESMYRGSGVVIGRSGSNCVIATADHVVRAREGSRVTSRGITMPDGRQYPAEIRMRDRENDIAVLVVNTGGATERICNPARIAEDPTESGPQVVASFPRGSRSVYLSPGQMVDMRIGQLRGEQHDSSLRFTIAHTEPGSSGGPMYNGNGEVAGLVRGGDASAIAVGAPLSRERVQQFMERNRSQSRMR